MPRDVAPIRDEGPFSNRYLSHGALLAESAELLAAMSLGLTPEGARKRAAAGTLFAQHSLANRQNLFAALHHRLFARQWEWVTPALLEAWGLGPESAELRGVLYLQYVLRDRLTYDFVTGPAFDAQQTARSLAIADGLAFLERTERENPPVARWSEWTRAQLFDRILGALADFGLLDPEGSGRIAGSPLTPTAVGHLLRVLHAEGVRGAELFTDTAWRVLRLDPEAARRQVEGAAEDLGVRVTGSADDPELQVPDDWW